MKTALKFLLRATGSLTILGLLYSLAWSSPALASDRSPKPVAAKYITAPSLPTRPCRDDSDDVNCFWDAGQRGNRKGYSYWVDRVGNVTYLDPKLNDKRKRKAWTNTNRKLKREYWGTVWGHRLCWAKVGDTSYIYCFDGYRETT